MSNIIDLEKLTLRELVRLPIRIEAVGKEVDKRLLEMNGEIIKDKIIESKLTANQFTLVLDFIDSVTALDSKIASWNRSFRF